MRLYRETPIMVAETIAAQGAQFGGELERILGNILSYIDEKNITTAREAANCPAYDVLEKVIFNRLKLKVSLNTTSMMIAACLPFYSNTNHVFLKEFFRGHLNIGDQQKVLKNAVGKRGFVDTKKAEVGGFFSEYTHPLYMNFVTLFKELDMTVPEVTAVLLHELGHLFSACEYADRVDETNQVLQDIFKVVSGDSPKKVDYIYNELKKVSPDVEKSEIDTYLNGPKLVAGPALFRIIHGVVQSQTQDGTYNRTAFEQQADAFASRFGYGRQLILALEKLPGENSKTAESIRTVTVVVNTCVLIGMCMMGLGALHFYKYLLSAASWWFLYVMVRSSGEDRRDYTYDELRHRYLRVRNDAVNQLKDQDLPKATVKMLLETIYTVDDFVKSIKDYRTPSEAIANYLFSSSKKAIRSVTDQQLMESMGANDLFLRSAEFRASA